MEIDIDQSHTQVSTISHVIKHEDLQIMIHVWVEMYLDVPAKSNDLELIVIQAG